MHSLLQIETMQSFKILILISVIPLVIKCQPESEAKKIIRKMLEDIKNHVAWDNYEVWIGIMSKYFNQDMVYDTNYFDGTNDFLGNGTGLERYQEIYYFCILHSIEFCYIVGGIESIFQLMKLLTTKLIMKSSGLQMILKPLIPVSSKKLSIPQNTKKRISMY